MHYRGRFAQDTELHRPDSATSATDTPCCFAMNPKTEKMTSPASILVKLLTPAKIKASLK